MFKHLKVTDFFARAIVALIVLTVFGARTQSRGATIEREIAWTEDYESAMQRAASTNSVVLLHFYGDYCPPCKLLDKKTFHDPALVSTINENLVPIKINADRRRDLAKKYAVTRWPTDVYLYSNGDEIYRGVSNADPAVYCKTIERVALRHRDWTVERNSTAKAKERRQDRALAAHTPQIQQENAIQSGNSGRAVRTQNAGWTNGLEPPQDAAPLERPIVRSTSRVINNPYLAEQPLVVPPSVRIDKTAQAFVPQVQTPPIEASNPPTNAAPIVNMPTAKPVAPSPIETPNPTAFRSAPAIAQATVTRTEPTTSKQLEAQFVSAPFESSLRPSNAAAETKPREPSPQSAPAVQHQLVYAETIGLGGFCPVTLIESLSQPNVKGWVEGKKSCAVRHRGRVYFCASEHARQTLLNDPDLYTPCLSGFDIVQFCKEGVLRDGKCEYGCIQEGTNRVFLFENKANYDAFSQNSLYYSRLLDKSEPERVANELNGSQIR